MTSHPLAKLAPPLANTIRPRTHTHTLHLTPADTTMTPSTTPYCYPDGQPICLGQHVQICAPGRVTHGAHGWIASWRATGEPNSILVHLSNKGHPTNYRYKPDHCVRSPGYNRHIVASSHPSTPSSDSTIAGALQASPDLSFLVDSLVDNMIHHSLSTETVTTLLSHRHRSRLAAFHPQPNSSPPTTSVTAPRSPVTNL